MSTEAILTEWMSTSMADASYITKLGHVVENEQLCNILGYLLSKARAFRVRLADNICDLVFGFVIWSSRSCFTVFSRHTERIIGELPLLLCIYVSCRFLYLLYVMFSFSTFRPLLCCQFRLLLSLRVGLFLCF